MWEFLKEWGIETKIFSITLDNASSNDVMQQYLKQQLSFNGTLLCDGDFFHIRCCAHILNLIVQEGLKVANDALLNIRENIKYVKASEARMIQFQERVKMFGDIQTEVSLRMDVSTRWNSTFVMLESALKYQRAFISLKLDDSNFMSCPSNEEWEWGKKMCDFLRPFYDITMLISGSTYPTSNLYFMQVRQIECLLTRSIMSEDDVISDMALRMKVKFDKY